MQRGREGGSVWGGLGFFVLVEGFLDSYHEFCGRIFGCVGTEANRRRRRMKGDEHFCEALVSDEQPKHTADGVARARNSPAFVVLFHRTKS